MIVSNFAPLFPIQFFLMNQNEKNNNKNTPVYTKIRCIIPHSCYKINATSVKIIEW